MRVLQVPFVYYPDPCGGTEVYVASLCEGLAKLGIEPVVAAPGDQNASYTWQGMEVRRFTGSPLRDVGDLYNEGDAVAAEAFDRILQEVRPDVVHFHSRTRAASLRCLRYAKQRGIKVVYTYHTPTATCQRGTMMFEGRTPCDGEMRVRRCAACVLRAKLPGLAASALAAVPPALGRKVKSHGGMWTALRTSSLQESFQRSTREFLSSADHIVAVCDWVRQVILRNGVSPEKVSLNRQGLAGEVPVRLDQQRNAEEPLRVAFLGRLDPTKGVDVLLRALRLKPDLRLHLDVFGIAQGEAGERYRRELGELAADDARVSFYEPVRGDQVVQVIQKYDLLAVPSQGLETGPLVVLEAFAAGIPVLGSRLGGIAELVTDGVNGRLVEAADVKAWALELEQAAGDSSLIREWRRGVPSPRVMSTVAAEMRDLYHAMLVS